jgi:GNAT superfamily N-acetyltransferase
MQIVALRPDQADLAVEVLADAFGHYPVMRYVLGRPCGPGDPDVVRLVRLFVAGRALRCHPILAAAERARVIGVATITPPGQHRTPDDFVTLHEATWSTLGASAQQRYETYANAHTAELPPWHHHLNMIGVRRSRAGQGIGRALLAAVRDLARADPGSAGVSLDTELSRNVELYTHLGFHVVDRVMVGGVMASWTMFQSRGEG